MFNLTEKLILKTSFPLAKLTNWSWNTSSRKEASCLCTIFHHSTPLTWRRPTCWGDWRRFSEKRTLQTPRFLTLQFCPFQDWDRKTGWLIIPLKYCNNVILQIYSCEKICGVYKYIVSIALYCIFPLSHNHTHSVHTCQPTVKTRGCCVLYCPVLPPVLLGRHGGGESLPGDRPAVLGRLTIL